MTIINLKFLIVTNNTVVCGDGYQQQQPFDSHHMGQSVIVSTVSPTQDTTKNWQTSVHLFGWQNDCT